MTGRDILSAMSYVDEKYIQEAETATIRKIPRNPWKGLASLAACLCILLAGVTVMAGMPRDEKSADTAAIGNGSAMPSHMEAAIDDAGEIAEDKETNGERPSLILRVSGVTEAGFTGAVSQIVDTDIFEVGTELNVVVETNTRYYENASGSALYGIPGKSLAEGMLVQVQFVNFDAESGTITVDHIEILEDTN